MGTLVVLGGAVFVLADNAIGVAVGFMLFLPSHIGSFYEFVSARGGLLRKGAEPERVRREERVVWLRDQLGGSA